ncbi:MAG: protein kinase [candidate division WOR-3 bacterium]
MVGQTVGDYKIVEEIGRGGFGIVYKGIHKLTEQEVAIKTIDPVLTFDPKFKERFFAEAKIQAKLNHPHIVVMHNFFQYYGRYFIVMEYVEGFILPNGKKINNLHELINLGPLSEERILQIFKQILDGVGYAHKKGVLHRDIKPLNILFTPEGLIKIADFGIAKIVAGETNVSASGTRVGTPLYMSPEQILNEPLDKTTDIYSLGVTLYEAAVGEVPFKATSSTSVEKQHLSSPPPPPREKNPNISKELERVILKALEKKKEDRFQSCEEFLKALEGIKKSENLIGVPLLIGKDIEEAKRILSYLGLNLIINNEEYSDDIPEGFIMKQIPFAGSLTEKGKEVNVILSKGKKTFIDIGETFKEDKVKEKSDREEVRKLRKREVKKRNPLIWIFIPIIILLFIGGYFLLKTNVLKEITKKEIPTKEIQKPQTFIMPDLRGLTLNDAKELLLEKGLILSKTESIYSDEVKKGEIISFSPQAGTEIKKGDTVNVIYSCGLKTCPKCGAQREPGAKFCSECGYQFDE